MRKIKKFKNNKLNSNLRTNHKKMMNKMEIYQ